MQLTEEIFVGSGAPGMNEIRRKHQNHGLLYSELFFIFRYHKHDRKHDHSETRGNLRI